MTPYLTPLNIKSQGVLNLFMYLIKDLFGKPCLDYTDIFETKLIIYKFYISFYKICAHAFQNFDIIQKCLFTIIFSSEIQAETFIDLKIYYLKANSCIWYFLFCYVFFLQYSSRRSWYIDWHRNCRSPPSYWLLEIIRTLK